MTAVCITTGARLHFGPLSVTAPSGGRFGGVGIMIASPRTVLTAKPAAVDSIVGDESATVRVAEFLRRIREASTSESRVPCEISVDETIPSHCGFGSGTQLGLAVARAVSLVENESHASLATLAHRVQRGLRSAIGLYGFEQGGFLVDGGRVESNQLGTLVSRLEFPADWRFVLVSPRRAIGLSGAEEQSAFARQSPMPAALTGELCRTVLMDWIPSVMNADFAGCSDAMYRYGYAVGEFFSPTQGGVFAHPRMREWTALIRRRGISGVAQTSWGPTVAALCSSHVVAMQMALDFSQDAHWEDCLFEVVEPLNRGADVRTL